MYFKKLELIGFKSFCNKTTLHFEPGITAVVGPNGCGKSNIFDSIRWVLGEQSIKSLRGSQMEDVIFNGTDSKEALGMAEVNLTFDNSNKFFPIEHDEAVITRRIFRSGESEYLLNKTQVRLKDILELLMGTGIGAESYSLVPQGRIDMILSSRPEDRRMVFDEASGITKYKAQKKEALRRLEETDQNLLRVNDIITEVKRQIGSLERQANKARRYKEVFEELKSKELKLATVKKTELEISRSEIVKQLTGLENQEAQLIDIITKHEEGLLDKQTELKNLEENILAIKNELLNLDNSLSRNKERVIFDKERIIELETDKKQLNLQIEQAKSRLAADEEKLCTFRIEYDAITKNIEDKTAGLSKNQTELNNISLSIKTSLENISSLKLNILESETNIVNTKNRLNDLTSNEQIQLARKKRLEVEKAKLNEEKAAIENILNNIKQEVESIQKEFQASTLRISGIKTDLNSEKNSLESINNDIESLEKENLSLKSQKQFLETLRTKYEDISESMNAVVYLDKIPSEKLNGLVIKIKDNINFSGSNNKPDDPIQLRISGEAKSFDLDTSKIGEKISQIEHKIEVLKNSEIEKKSHIETLDKTLSEQEATLHSQEITLANKNTSLQSTLEQFTKLNEEGELIKLELSDIEQEISAIKEKSAELNLNFEELQKEERKKQESITSEQNNITLNNQSKEEVLVLITQTKTELDALIKRVSSDKITLKMLQDRHSQDNENLTSIEKQILDCDTKHTYLISEIKELENSIVKIGIDIETKTRSLKETDAQYNTLSATLNDIIKSIDQDKKESDTLKNRLYQLQMQNKDIEFKFLSIKERLLQAYKIDLDLLTIGQGEAKQVIAESVFNEEIQKLKEKLDSYGTVNLVAIEEYDELKKRYDFLNQQQTDLVTAKESLHEAILKINRTTKKMFLDTFEKIRVEFRNYFKLLFNGGDAQIYLIDEGDPLESGIEIICRPPGKKLQNVLLLSGGEKSMSAIALIFAIFKIKPAPFCVLDEIDAALDEANIDRFGRVLQEFSKISQFIVITHNKKTIANADIMYGITMEESGVSKIVSVKFAQNKSSQKDKNPGNQALTEPEPV